MMLVIVQLIERYIIQLGTEGRLVQLQLEEMMVNVREDRAAMLADYLPDAHAPPHRRRRGPLLGPVPSDDLLSLSYVGTALGFGPDAEALDKHVRPRGFRLLHKIPRLDAQDHRCGRARISAILAHHRGPRRRAGRRRGVGLPARARHQGRAQPHLRDRPSWSGAADVRGRRHGGLPASRGGPHPGDRGAGFPGQHPPLLQHPDPAQRHEHHGADRGHRQGRRPAGHPRGHGRGGPRGAARRPHQDAGQLEPPGQAQPGEDQDRRRARVGRRGAQPRPAGRREGPLHRREADVRQGQADAGLRADVREERAPGRRGQLPRRRAGRDLRSQPRYQ